MRNGEFTRADLVVDPEMEADPETGTVTAYLETWFDADAKFGLHTAEEDAWVNLYASYIPETGELKMEYGVIRQADEEWHEYTPTASEKSLILSMMEECCQDRHSCSLEGYLQDSDCPAQTM